MYDVFIYLPKHQLREYKEGDSPSELLVEVDNEGIDLVMSHIKKYVEYINL